MGGWIGNEYRFSVGSVCSIVKVHGYVEIIHYLQIANDSNAEMVSCGNLS